MAHTQKLVPSPTLVDTVLVNAGPRTLIVPMGMYVCAFALCKEDEK